MKIKHRTADLIDLFIVVVCQDTHIGSGVGCVWCTVILGHRSDNCPVRINGGERVVLANDEVGRQLWLAR
jgi:hypothetical protein